MLLNVFKVILIQVYMILKLTYIYGSVKISRGLYAQFYFRGNTVFIQLWFRENWSFAELDEEETASIRTRGKRHNLMTCWIDRFAPHVLVESLVRKS